VFSVRAVQSGYVVSVAINLENTVTYLPPIALWSFVFFIDRYIEGMFDKRKDHEHQSEVLNKKLRIQIHYC
jgi:hypothetical protein